jgi:glycosyltransferase involved in cell wall biosynthesis
VDNLISNTNLISIVIPLFNYEKYIKDCIESIKNQDYKNIETIVIDDCSYDNSYNIVKKLDCDKIIHLDKNMGYSRAKNEGIINSNGNFICVLDADDMLTKNSISCRINTLLKNDVPFIFANAINIFDDISLEECYKLKNIQLYSEKLYKNKITNIQKCNTVYHIHAQTAMVSRELYKKYGLYDEKLRSRSDREMWWRFFGKDETDIKKEKSFYLDYEVVYYRNHKKSMTYKRIKDKKYDEQVRKISDDVYKQRKEEGINKNNTIFLDK